MGENATEVCATGYGLWYVDSLQKLPGREHRPALCRVRQQAADIALFGKNFKTIEYKLVSFCTVALQHSTVQSTSARPFYTITLSRAPEQKRQDIEARMSSLSLATRFGITSAILAEDFSLYYGDLFYFDRQCLSGGQILYPN